MIEDRSLTVRPDQTVRTSWVDVDRCTLGCRDRMDPGSVERKYRQLLQIGDAAMWPPLVGFWQPEGKGFVVNDGRHEFIASLMLGRTKVLVCWIEDQPQTPGWTEKQATEQQVSA